MYLNCEKSQSAHCLKDSSVPGILKEIIDRALKYNIHRFTESADMPLHGCMTIEIMIILWQLTVTFCTDTMVHLLLPVVTSMVTALTYPGILK